MKLCKALPRTAGARVIANQLLRSGTSVGANYRAACRARSKAEFLSRLAVVLEEAEESEYWRGLLLDGAVMKEILVGPLRIEAGDLVRIFGAAESTMRTQIQNARSTQDKLGIGI
jgi:four helix bundle protein